MRADLVNTCLPDRVQSLAIQKQAITVADLLFLTFMTYLPSEPLARVECLTDIEAPVRPARTFAEALSFLRTWRQKILTVVNDLGGNPEPLKLLSSLRSLISSLVAGDTAFAMEISQVYKTTNVKITCSDDAFLQTLDLIEIELSSRAHEDEEEKRKQKSAGVAIASLTQGSKPKPLCRDYMTETGCNKGGQCPFQHPPTTGRCLRCGSTKHVVSECKRPRRDSAPASSSNPGAAKGKGKGPPLPKSKAGAKKGAKGGQKGGTSTGGGSGGKSSGTGAQPKAQPSKQPNKRSQQQPKAKPKPKATAHSAEAGSMELDWVNADVYDPSSSSGAFPSPPFAGLASVEDFASVCTFYTTYNPSFHSSEQTDENGLLPPTPDTRVDCHGCLLQPFANSTGDGGCISTFDGELGQRRLFSLEILIGG